MEEGNLLMTISIDPKIQENFSKAVNLMKKRKLAKSMSKEIETFMVEYTKAVTKTTLEHVADNVEEESEEDVINA